MNQNTPNPGVALRWPHPCSIPIEWGIRGRPPNEPSTVIERSGVVLDTLRSGCRQGTEMGSAAILARGIMINSRGERRTKALEGTEDFQQTPSNIRRRNQRVQTTVTTNPHMRSVEFSHVALGDPLATGVGLWLKLIPFIITFDLIWLWKDWKWGDFSSINNAKKIETLI